MAEEEVAEFLTHLTRDRDVSPSTQNRDIDAVEMNRALADARAVDEIVHAIYATQQSRLPATGRPMKAVTARAAVCSEILWRTLLSL